MLQQQRQGPTQQGQTGMALELHVVAVVMGRGFQLPLGRVEEGRTARRILKAALVPNVCTHLGRKGTLAEGLLH
jgi:hypothetical protein